MQCFVNFSNHPSTQWSDAQLAAARRFGKVLDLPFPSVPPTLDERSVLSLAEQYVDKILQLNPTAVMCQGEFSLCFAVTRLLQRKEVAVLCACSERVENKSEFVFVRFRNYMSGEGK